MIRAIVVEDEVPALNKMIKLLEASNQTMVVGKFTKALEALDFLRKNQVDAVFLDIEMPDMNGLEFSTRMLDIQEGAAIIFVTAYSKYAVEAFQLNALDYLMKPVSSSRLGETLKKIIHENEIKIEPESINIQCFGRFGIIKNREKVKFRTQKAEELLAFMIDRKGSYVSRSDIIDNLWGDFDGERALIHFNTTLHYIKKALLAYGIQIPITYDRGGYKFDVAGLDCDYLKLSNFVEEGKIPSQENIFRFEEIVGLYQGEYLLGCDYNWVAIKRQLLEEQYVQLIINISVYYIATTEYQNAAKWLKLGLQRDPINKELNYKLVEVLLLDKDKVLAFKYYELYKKAFIKNFGHEPEQLFVKLLYGK